MLEATLPGIGYTEDWTDSIQNLCMRCSYGTPHRHDRHEAGNWQPDRNLGIAAQSRKSVEKLLDNWMATGSDRHVDGIETHEAEIPKGKTAM